jgi:hypothetical protein
VIAAAAANNRVLATDLLDTTSRRQAALDSAPEPRRT